MNRNLRSVLILLGVLVLTLIAYYTLKLPSESPGKDRTAEIIDPLTLARTPTTWDHILKHGLPDMAGAGGYIAPLPGKNYWGYAIDTGKSHPCESVPPDQRQPLNPK